MPINSVRSKAPRGPRSAIDGQKGGRILLEEGKNIILIQKNNNPKTKQELTQTDVRKFSPGQTQKHYLRLITSYIGKRDLWANNCVYIQTHTKARNTEIHSLNIFMQTLIKNTQTSLEIIRDETLQLLAHSPWQNNQAAMCYLVCFVFWWVLEGDWVHSP